jgi:hypothetical protein
VPYHRRSTESARPEETGRPPLRLDDASDARVRTIRRA